MKSHIPPYLRETHLHVRLCEDYVNIKYGYLDKDIQKLLVNLYRKESSTLFEITEKKFLNQETDPLDKINVSISNFKFKIKTLLKVISNKVFLFFRKKHLTSRPTIVRSWVEDCLELFKTDIDQNCTFLVYPFAIKIKRQLLFLKELKKRNLDYSLIGLNYSWSDLFKWLYTSKDLDYAYMEYNANQRHAELLLNEFNINKILTTDEFEIASFVMYNKLKPAIHIINSAHGIGKYSPYINYNTFYVFNNAQKDYYQPFSPAVEYKIIQKPIPDNFQFNGNVILISQALDYNDHSFVSTEELKIIDFFKNIDDFQFYVKVHPNSKIKELTCSKSGKNLLLDDQSKMNNSIFLTLFSTAYYDFQTYGLTYLVETEYNKPQLAFGKDERIIHLSELKTFLKTIKE